MAKEVEYARVQGLVEKELFRRAKTIAAYNGTTMADLLTELIENYVDEHEDAYLDQVLGKKLQAAHDGKPIKDIANVTEYYKELKKRDKLNRLKSKLKQAD